MKKTFVTLLAVAGLTASAQGSTTFTSSSKVDVTSGYTGNTYSGNLDDIDLWGTAYGVSNKSEITGAFPLDGSGTLIVGADQMNSTALNNKQINLSNLHSSTTLDSQVELVSYSFLTRYNTSVTNGLYAQVLDSTGALLGTSQVVSYDSYATTNNIYGAGTFNFDAGIILSSTETYTFKLVNAEGVAYTANVGLGGLNPYYYSSQGGGYTIDGNAGWQPIISIVTASVPEPATASLSLLGLVALMMRRRRA